MSYTIGNVIYGAPVELPRDLAAEGIDEDEGREEALAELGIVELYSSGGPPNPAYCGVKLAEVDESDDVDLEALVAKARREATPAKRAKAEKLVAALPTWAKAKKPAIYIVWSSS